MTGWRPDGNSFYYMRLLSSPPVNRRTKPSSGPSTTCTSWGRTPTRTFPVLGFGINPAIKLDPNDFSIVAVTPASSYAIGLIGHGVRNEYTIYVAPLAEVTGPNTPWKKLSNVDDDVTGFDWRGDTVYLQTHKDAPTFKVIQTSLARPDIANAKTIVAPSENVIQQIQVASDALYVRGLDGGLGTVSRLPFTGDGNVGAQVPIALPYEGAVSLLATDPRDDGATIGLRRGPSRCCTTRSHRTAR